MGEKLGLFWLEVVLRWGILQEAGGRRSEGMGFEGWTLSPVPTPVPLCFPVVPEMPLPQGFCLRTGPKQWSWLHVASNCQP